MIKRAADRKERYVTAQHHLEDVELLAVEVVDLLHTEVVHVVHILPHVVIVINVAVEPA